MGVPGRSVPRCRAPRYSCAIPPRLLSRLLDPRNGRLEDEFQPVRPLQGLNRARPKVEVLEVKPIGADWAEVVVRVCPGMYLTESGRGGKLPLTTYDYSVTDDLWPSALSRGREGGGWRRSTTIRRLSDGVPKRGSFRSNDPRVVENSDKSATLAIQGEAAPFGPRRIGVHRLRIQLPTAFAVLSRSRVNHCRSEE